MAARGSPTVTIRIPPLILAAIVADQESHFADARGTKFTMTSWMMQAVERMLDRHQTQVIPEKTLTKRKATCKTKKSKGK